MITGAALGFISLATAIGLVIDVPHLLILHFHHAETTGRVIRVIPNSHGLTEIAYSVRGTEYDRELPGYWVPLSRAGSEPIPVYYNPNDPSIAAAVPTTEILSGQLPSWIGGSALGALFGTFAARNIVLYFRR